MNEYINEYAAEKDHSDAVYRRMGWGGTMMEVRRETSAIL